MKPAEFKKWFGTAGPPMTNRHNRKPPSLIAPELVRNDSVIIMEIAIETTYEGNKKQHWSQRARRFKRQEKAFTQFVVAHGLFNTGKKIVGPISVLLTRIGGRRMDEGDNLPMSLKHVRDCVAKWIHRNDNDPSIAWDCAQEPDLTANAKLGVRVTIKRRQLSKREKHNAQPQSRLWS